MRILRLFFLLLATAAVGSCSKYNYTDDLQQLGRRVEILEQLSFNLNSDLEALRQIVTAIESRGYVTGVEQNADGTFVITFSNGRTVSLRHGRQGADGRDGQEMSLLISVAQDTADGQWYWTLGGTWLLNADGERMRVGAVDGSDGQDGSNGLTASEGAAVIPQVRINPDTRRWEISTDGGETWSDTGVSADGQDGRDGQDGHDGRNGQDDLFLKITVAADGKSITFVLRDGRTFTVPIQ